MATKLLNIRMEQKMIDELKKVCEELDISVTDAIKHFSTNLIKERTLTSTNENKNAKEIIKDMNDERTFNEVLTEINDANYDIEKFEKTFEEISDIVLFYYKAFNKIISENPFACCEKSYEYFIEKFENEYGDRLKNEIIKKLINICKLRYDDSRSSFYELWEIEKNLSEGKMLETMKKLKKQNPNLFKELINEYSYNIPYTLMFILNCNTYEEAKEKLESSLTKEEIKIYLEYENCPKEKLSIFNEELKKDEIKYKIFITACEKIDIFNKKNLEKLETVDPANTIPFDPDAKIKDLK